MRQQRGFTLLEALVVLVLVALVAWVLADGAGRLGDLRQRLAVRVEGAGERAMRVGWFRQSIASAVPDLPGGEGVFRGDANGLTALSTMPLAARPGAPTVITWRITESAPGVQRLDVHQGGAPIEALRWRGPPGRFAYLDGAGVAHERWPDTAGAPQLPAAVLLQFSADDLPVVAFAAITGAKDLPAAQIETGSR
jgi:prepilin-type N-terminal cleavage/methylation domain-containing protein